MEASMYGTSLAAAVLMVSGSAAAVEPSWLTVGENAYAQLKLSGYKVTIRANLPARDGAADNLYLIEVKARDVPHIAATLHRKLRHCGGFMFHRSETAARAALASGALRPAPAATRPSYELANQALVAPVLAQMDEQHIAATIAGLSAFVNRTYSSPHGVAAANWLSRTWSEIAASHASIAVTQFTHTGYGQRSVIATIAGSDKASEVVVLGAHLDSINLGSFGSSAVAPGADDDASGVAGLTEVLRVLAAANYRPRRTIKLIGYAAEEVGLRGSQEIAREFKKNQVDVVGVLQLDMTNFKGSARDIYLISDYTDGAQNKFLEKLIAAYLPAVTVGTDKCGYACSDHAAWDALGYATSMPFEALLSQDNPHIHGKNDSYANSGNQAAHALKFARMAAAYAIELGTGSP
jgi:leucyl aminopeptidase